MMPEACYRVTTMDLFPGDQIVVCTDGVLEAADDRAAKLAELAANYRQEFANPYRAAEHLHVDDVIDPEETRQILIRALQMCRHKTETTPTKKHGNIPL